MKKKLIFGLSAGRSGSASLALLLSNQNNTMVTHELFPILPWDNSKRNNIQFRWEQLHHQSHLFDVVGDVGIYYLPYVNFLMNSWQKLPYLQEKYELKFIILQRQKEKVVASYLEKFSKQNNNPLQNHGDDNLVTNEWDKCFPKYDDVSLEKAISLFYDDYYAQVEILLQQHPNHVKLFPTKALNSKKGVLSILKFVGFNKPNIKIGIKKRKH